MLLTPTELERLTIYTAAELARKRKAKGLLLNHPEAVAYIDEFYRVYHSMRFVGQTLVINLKFGPSRERSIAGIRRISKPGLRVYAKSTSLPRVLGGLGVAIISTSSGLLTDRQAAKKGVGGEVLAYVW